MSIDILPSPVAPLAARLLIHARTDTGSGGNFFVSLLRRLRAWSATGRRRDATEPVTVHIEDAQGSRVFAIDDAEPLIDLALPAGTYLITAHRGEVRRGYTMTLLRGKSVDLHLRLTPERR